ncbi:SulP family inorganic anion transporter [uncultured Ilyobacter sp.]|uniref:SulP family inorganic anion transporter n=1 Tax=uncultured Ilyobacter sp. TaxID=544433 RepID=UPI0029F508EC|nr:SulP family inorganic anion transporter [uncultured Ilyobacter sp.]
MSNFLKGKLNIKDDVLAGLTVAFALVPEVVAFAFVAGIDPIVGLNSAVIIGLCTAIFGGRPGMISGAAGSIAVVFTALVALHGVEYLFATVVVMGIVQILVGVFKFGKFARMIPHSVMLGFVNGLAIVIFLAQLNQLKIDGVWISGPQLYVVLGLVALTMGIIHFLPKLTKAVPASLVAIVVTTGLSMYSNKMGIHIPNVLEFSKGGIAGELPKFHIPEVPLNFETLKIVLPFAVTAAMVGLIESLLTMSLIDDLTDTRGQANRESIGQGIGNFMNGLMGGTGGCAMIGQSMINLTSGGRGRISGVSTALALLSFVLFGSKIIGVIPLAALVGVMFMVVIETFAWETLKYRKRIPKKDFLIILIVAIITVEHDLALAVIVGIIISALIFAWEKGKRISAEIKVNENGTKVYILEGPLFFGSAANFKDLFDVQNDPEVVAIDFCKSKVTDHSAIEAINNITDKYRQAGKKLKLKHLSRDCNELLKNAEEIIEVNIVEDPKYFVADNELA